ncbi:MAG: Polysacc synt protein [Patescibacteria group bacterium]|nr:Polysacc synt protein [Patescibacteria group bacterium]
MKVARKIAYNVLASSASKIASTVLALVSIGFITRYLGKDGFGDYATVLAFFAFFSAISDLGLYQISTREISREGADAEKIMGNVFTLRIVSAAAVVFVSPLVVWFLPYSSEVKMGIIVAGAAYLFSSAYQILNGIFQKNLSMDKVSFSELGGKILQVLFIIAAVKFNLGFAWIIFSLLVYMTFVFFAVFFFSRRYVRVKLRFDWDYWKTFLKQSLPMGGAAVITFLYFKMDTLLLSVMKGSADVGVYNAAYKVLENITFFPAMIVGLVLPIMSLNVFSNRVEFESVANKTFKFFAIMTIPLVVGTLFLADGIIDLIGGAGFSESAYVLRILVFPLALIFFGHLFNAVLIVSNLQKKLMAVLGVAAFLNIGLNLIFIPKYSYVSAAYVSLATELAVVALAAGLVVKKVKYIPRLEKKGAVVFSGLLMAAYLFAFRNLNFFFLALSSAGVYFFLLWATRAVKTSEIAGLVKKSQ